MEHTEKAKLEWIKKEISFQQYLNSNEKRMLVNFLAGKTHCNVPLHMVLVSNGLHMLYIGEQMRVGEKIKPAEISTIYRSCDLATMWAFSKKTKDKKLAQIYYLLAANIWKIISEYQNFYNK